MNLLCNVLIIWILKCFKISSTQNLIVIPPGTQVKGLGEDLVLTCKLAPSFDQIGIIINIQWFDGITGLEILDRTPGRDNTPYIDKSVPQTSKLYINGIMAKHAATYTCSAVIGGNRESVTSTLEVLREITVTDTPSEQYPQIYTDATIFCKVTGQPNPEVFWRFKGVRLVGGRYSQDLYGLRIKNITEQDNGVYDCCAEIESLGKIHVVPINVIVRVPPTISYFEDSEGISSHEFSFNCLATALPPAKYDFYKDDNPQVVFSTDRIMVDRDGGQLFFRPLIPEDRGTYKCKAFNDVGESSKIAVLTVIVPPKIYAVRNVTQTEGKSTTLVCLTYGDPEPEMTYRKAGLSESYIMGSNEGGRIMLTKPGPLELDMTIFPLRWDDTANYTCIAKNKGGVHVWNGTIFVQYVPRFSAEMPRIVYNWAGKTRNLTCIIFSEPKPVVEWYRLGRLLQNNETFRIYYINKDSNLQVTIRQVDEYYIYGEYICKARNQIGANQTSIEMRRAYLPDAPRSATVIRATPTSLELLIVPPNDEGLHGLPLFGFWVQCENRILEFLYDERVFIEYLRPGNTYEILTRVRTEIGIGGILKVSGTTLDISAPYPLTINSDPRSNFPFEYTVTWMRPETGGMPIRQYQFRFRQVSVVPGTFKLKEGLSEWKRRIKNTDISYPSLFYRIQGLTPDAYYQLEIQALNDVGWSIPNGMFIFRTSFDPLQDPYYDYEDASSDIRVIHLILLRISLTILLILYF